MHFNFSPLHFFFFTYPLSHSLISFPRFLPRFRFLTAEPFPSHGLHPLPFSDISFINNNNNNNTRTPLQSQKLHRDVINKTNYRLFKKEARVTVLRSLRWWTRLRGGSSSEVGKTRVRRRTRGRKPVTDVVGRRSRGRLRGALRD